ncbi:HAD family hydrolase [Pseudomonas guariconensis]|uniref:Haloacid dehalogenase n=1 Tax=Pseudomonas guariconensis TaxID=1288410 RepID=A0AAX0VUX4_9PSED|nr:HAD family hydrolase [Pseudomonas guariconensis]MEB3841153.1 haloacid dehalogenase-like hydrolase [Pseudomonas guariconensis]MEB3874021.1 haloacid dehalogenase-like hydrolase [Pseudomonas guariconensis]MEB3877549.1 haloacid dehalogenase-like hydrolase [Pseudomonas guariconensis]MEB3893999.1 haloacid dehalogenase-like hydrolase [Pseudomonas guariconensis]PLV18018.1 haloacid dehalogenase [Pseudomonas guariconensis]
MHLKTTSRSIHWLLVLALFLPALARAAEALPSWNDGPSREAIIDFVEAVSAEGSKDYVAPAQRIAVFDNDGTLWSEQPMYFQVLFAMAEVRRLAAQHPQWKSQQPFKAVLENDQKTLAASGMKGLMQIVTATHTGISTEAFRQNAQRWLASNVHPRTHRPYTEMVFQPMLELLAYLRANGFKTYIVSGGEVAFMRTFAEEVYGIPPEQVIGTTFASRFQDLDGELTIQRLAPLTHNDDGPGKPESIEAYIGRRPILAFGNSDGDLQMLQWTMAGPGRRLAGLVHHTDAGREWAYDRQSGVGRLDKALDEARHKEWVIVDMAKEWNRIYPFDQETHP